MFSRWGRLPLIHIEQCLLLVLQQHHLLLDQIHLRLDDLRRGEVHGHHGYLLESWQISLSRVAVLSEARRGQRMLRPRSALRSFTALSRSL